MYIDFKIENITAVAKQSTRFSKKNNYTDPKIKSYQNMIALHAKKAQKGNELIENTPLAVSISIVKEIPKSWSKKKTQQALHGEILPTTKPDIDNYTKPILDAMNGIIYKDDSCICGLTVLKTYSDIPSIHITINSDFF